MNSTAPWYLVKDIDSVDTPALVVYADRVHHNIQLLVNEIDDIGRLRPHVKTHKMLEITQMMLDLGITKFKCATIAEAEMLAMCNCIDVLLAYQPCGPKLERFLKLQTQYPNTQFSCLVDNITSSQEIDRLAGDKHSIVQVYIDLNVGMNRTGIQPDHSVELAYALKKLSHIKLQGLHAYDGHTQELDLAERTAVCHQIYSKVYSVKQFLEASGFHDLTLIMGGSPSFPVYAKLGAVECSPGTFVFWDNSYLEKLPEQDFLPAALVLGRVVSMPANDRICLDIGHKSIGAENSLQQRIKFLNAPALTILGQSEEHLVVQVGVDHSYKVGDLFYGLPFHICPSCALYESASVVKNHHITHNWEVIARKRKITI